MLSADVGPPAEFQHITNSDLRREQYDMETLERNIQNLELDVILITQRLTMEFIGDVICDENNQITVAEKDIDLYTILHDQPHINKEEFIRYISK